MAMLAVQSSIASPKRLAAPRVIFILRGESYVGYPCFGADVQHLDNVFCTRRLLRRESPTACSAFS
jgi:hypothetical protein